MNPPRLRPCPPRSGWSSAGGTGQRRRAAAALVGSWLLLVGVASLGGCQTSYRKQAATTIERFTAGDYLAAESTSLQQVQSSSSSGTDRVLWLYETGRAAQVAAGVESDPGRRSDLIEQSVRAFDEAHALTVPYLDEEAERKVGQAAAAIVLCPTVIPYRGWLCDRVMAGGLNAVNLLALRRFEDARVELNRSRDWQDDAERRFDDRRRDARNAWHNGGKENAAGTAISTLDQAKLESLYDDAQLASQRERESMWGGPSPPPYPGHTNPFVDHLRGVVTLALADGDQGDLDAASIWLRVREGDPQLRQVIEPDLKRIENLKENSLSPRPRVVYVYFLSGVAPRFEEVKIPIPTPWATATIALPRPVASPAAPRGFGVRVAGGDGEPMAAVTLAEIDRIVLAEFQARRAEIYAAQFANAAFYGTAQGLLNSWAAAGGGLRALVAMYLVNATARYLTASADLRSWRTLPGRVDLSRVELPIDHRGPLDLQFSMRGRDGGSRQIGSWRFDDPGDYNIVVVTVPSLDAKASIVGAAIPPGGKGGIAGQESPRIVRVVHRDDGGNPLADSNQVGLEYSLAFEGTLRCEAERELSEKLIRWSDGHPRPAGVPLRVALDRSVNDTSTRFAAMDFLRRIVERCGWTIDEAEPEYFVGVDVRRQRLTDGSWRQVEFSVAVALTERATGHILPIEPWTGNVTARQAIIGDATPAPPVSALAARSDRSVAAIHTGSADVAAGRGLER